MRTRRSILLLFLSSFFLGLSMVAAKVGTPCSVDKQCGENEYCKKAEHVSTPCQIGKCTCERCHEVDANDVCSPIVKLNIGDKCDNLGSNYKFPLNAICTPNHIVSCAWGWMEFGNVCVKNASTNFGSSCRWSSDCSSDMWCNDEAQCTCYYAYDKYDSMSEACVKKEYGDECSTNSECRVYGQSWNGYTFSTGECREGRCDCSTNGKLAITGYVDELTGSFRTKPICVISGAHVNASIGERCTVDPIYYGDTPTTSVCGPESFCYQCPEDVQQPGFGSFDGKCRCPLKEPTVPSSEDFLSFAPEGEATPDPALVFSGSAEEEYVADENAPAADDEPFEVADETPAMEVTGEPVMVTWEFNEDASAAVGPRVLVEKVVDLVEDAVGGGSGSESENDTEDDFVEKPPPIRRCFSRNDCLANERCLMSAQCNRGICACTPPYQEDEDGECIVGYSEINSSPQPSEDIDDTFLVNFNHRESLNQIYHPPARTSINGYDDYEAANASSSASYKMACFQSEDCLPLPGTVCQQLPPINDEAAFPFGCVCPEKMFWYKNSTCKPAEFGDPCEHDDGCDTGLYAGDAGYHCSLTEKRCVCSQNFTLVNASVLRATWGTRLPDLAYLQQKMFSVTSYCLPQDVRIKIVGPNENCTLHILNEDDTVKVCDSGLTCLYCAGDTVDGICTELIPKHTTQRTSTSGTTSRETTRTKLWSLSSPLVARASIIFIGPIWNNATSGGGISRTTRTLYKTTTLRPTTPVTSTIASNSNVTLTQSSVVYAIGVTYNVRKSNNLEKDDRKAASGSSEKGVNLILFVITVLLVPQLADCFIALFHDVQI